MSEAIVFQPDRRKGTVFHSVILMILVLVLSASLWMVAQADVSPAFLVLISPAIAALGSIFWVAYRLFALHASAYLLERDGIRLRWGLRLEEIPIDEVLWVHKVSELNTKPPLPFPRWPGSILGHRHIHGENEVEYMAASREKLVLIALENRWYAVSPSNPDEFIQTYQRLTELGSLAPLNARSVYPSYVLNRVRRDKAARALLFTGIGLSLLLIIWVILVVSTRENVVLGFNLDGTPGEAVPSVRLFLLPLVNTVFLLANMLFGFLLFRREDSMHLSYILWGSGVFIAVFFLFAVFFLTGSI